MPRRGVTVIEVMVTLVVLTLLTTAVALSPAAQRADEADQPKAVRACRLRAVEDRREVVNAARALACLPDGDTIWLPPLLPSGDSADAEGRYFWR